MGMLFSRVFGKYGRVKFAADENMDTVQVNFSAEGETHFRMQVKIPYQS